MSHCRGSQAAQARQSCTFNSRLATAVWGAILAVLRFIGDAVAAALRRTHILSVPEPEPVELTCEACALSIRDTSSAKG